MSIPLQFPGMGDIIYLIKEFRNLKEGRYKQSALKAWRAIKFQDACRVLVEYYGDRSVPLFSYPCSLNKQLKVPLYVRREWIDLRDESLSMSLERSDVRRPHQPTQYQKDFLMLYHWLRRELGLSEIWDGTIFRLTNMQTSPDKLSLEFELGSFFDSVMYHYVLEHELVTAIAGEGAKASEHLELRDRVAGHALAIEGFSRNNVSRIGVSNLLLLRSGENTYFPVVQRRGSQSLASGLDTLSSGVFDNISAPKVDFGLKHKVLVEVEEEIYGNKALSKQVMEMNPQFFYEYDGIRDLLEKTEKGAATFQVTGFCIDLIRLVPEITTVWVVRDTKYYDRHYQARGAGRLMKISEEHQLTSRLQIPRRIQDADDFLANSIVTDPDSTSASHGFDPMLWTLPGAFCFYQGIKRAVTAGLL
jgi:hypothetical protein